MDKTGLYADTLAASSGCDSIINIDFRLNTPSYGTIEVKRCYSFKSPSGKYEWFESGSYFDTLVNSQGCDSIQTIDLTIDAPLVDLGDDKAICKRSETELKIRTARLDSIYWSTGESQSSILVNKTGTYWVDVFRYDCSVRDTVIVFESESDTCECKLFIPNSFTPSTSTLINDEYYVLSSCELTEFQLTVFDRWGSILFSTQDINEKWDGIKKNKPVESGAYYYVIKAKSINEDEFNENGILIINR
jgi:gliding motility-associated-like protein